QLLNENYDISEMFLSIIEEIFAPEYLSLKFFEFKNILDIPALKFFLGWEECKTKLLEKGAKELFDKNMILSDGEGITFEEFIDNLDQMLDKFLILDELEEYYIRNVNSDDYADVDF